MAKKIWIVTALIVVAVIVLIMNSSNSPGKYDEFAKCLSDNGAKMFGAFWCPHCQAQKKMFGKSWEEIKYIECSEPDGQTQDPICRLAGIQSYPTWEFSDGSRLTGELSFETLSQRTGCPLP